MQNFNIISDCAEFAKVNVTFSENEETNFDSESSILIEYLKTVSTKNSTYTEMDILCQYI